MDKKERDEKIEVYGRGFGLLTTALKDVPDQAWKFKPVPTEWSVHEIIVHMADSESMAALRLRKLVVEPGSTLMAYEESRWADALNYLEHSTEDALQVIKFARQTTYGLLKRLPDGVFTQSVIHPEYKEPYTFDRWLNIYSKHIHDHIEQIKNNVQAWREVGR